MRICRFHPDDTPGLAPAPYGPTALTLGSFDGVHRGHLRILKEVRHRAIRRGLTPAVLTFTPHPREVFSPGHAPNLLTSERKKLALLEENGMEAVFLMTFDQRAAGMNAERFAGEVIGRYCGAREMVTGPDVRFGEAGSGDFELLSRLGDVHGYVATRMPPVFHDGERISSTLIRERVLHGDLDGAARLLGRRYAIMGEIVQGRGIGRVLGFPTANIRPHHSAAPPNGVYVAEVILDGARHPAAVNIGIAPTIRDEDALIEAFLLQFQGDILHREIEVEFRERLRPERKFASREALVEQISRDVAAVEAAFQRDDVF